MAEAAPAAVTSSSLTVDANTHLIAGLNGAGLVANTTGRFTGLATVSGGVVVPYTYADGDAQTFTASGAIVSNVNSNVFLNANSALAMTLGLDGTVPTSTYLNTILGNATSTTGPTVTIASGNTLVMGKVGGIYASDGGGTGTTKNLLTIAGAGALSAGGNTAGSGTLVFGVGDNNNTSNEIQITTTLGITDNPLGGAVTVVVVGTGSMYINNNSSYSGGTYITQGVVLQGNNQAAGPNTATPYGTGPVYIAGGASAFPNLNGKSIAGGAVTFPNDFYISPGLGYAGSEGSMKTGNEVFSGKITAQGTPSSTGAAGTGDRISGSVNGGTTTLTGQVTGSGTLEFAAIETSSGQTSNFLLQNTTGNPNDWGGGLIISSINNVNTVVKLGANDQIPDGNSAGNVTIQAAFGSGTQNRLDLNGFSDTINGLNGVNSTKIQVTNFGAAPSTLTLGGNDATASYGGVFQDTAGPNSLSITKVGNGTQTIVSNSGTGANSTIHGTITVKAGTLALSGNFSSNFFPNAPSIIVGDTVADNAAVLDVSGVSLGFHVLTGQTLAGYGTVTGNATIDSGAFLSPGNSIGTLTTNGNAEVDGTLQIDLDGFFDAVDELNDSAGALTLGGASTVNFSVTGTPSASAYIFASYNSLSGAFLNTLNVPAGYTVAYGYGGNNIALVQVPEPASVCLAAIGLAGLVVTRLRRRVARSAS